MATNEGWSSAPTDRLSQAAYILNPSSKAQYCVRETLRLQAKDEKLLIYCDWPTSVWLMKTLYDILGFKAARISAGQSAKERSALTDRFNNPQDNGIMVLICSSRSAAESYNFQKDCHNIIVMDLVNFNTILQIIGRCYRIGQKHEQFIKILMLDRSYDQVLLAQYASAMVAQLAATSGVLMDGISDDHCEDALNDPGFAARVQDLVKFGKLTQIEAAREELYTLAVQGKLRANFGLRTDRDNELWANARALDAKLLIPGEHQYHLTKKGPVAEHARRILERAQITSTTVPPTPVSKGAATYISNMQKQQALADKKRQREETDAMKADKRAAKRRKLEAEKAKKEAKEKEQFEALLAKRGLTIANLAPQSGEYSTRFTGR